MGAFTGMSAPSFRRPAWLEDEISAINIAIKALRPESRFMLGKQLIAPKSIQAGQVWKLADSSVQIGLVGKTLVHYKHYKIKQPRVPNSLINIGKLEKFLSENQAVLVQE